jgi:hypothetical protein
VTAPPERQVRRLIGVYNAEGSLLGELRYLIGRARRTAHCALCDVTHGHLRKKRAFSEFQASYPAPIELLHLDEQPDGIAAVTRGRTPCVLAETADGYRMLLDTDAIACCAGDVQRFEAALVRAVRAQNLSLAKAPAAT